MCVISLSLITAAQQPPVTTVFSSRAIPSSGRGTHYPVWNSLHIHVRTRSAETLLTFKSRLKLNCSRPVTTPDISAPSHHGAPDSLAIDIRAQYKFILHYITLQSPNCYTINITGKAIIKSPTTAFFIFQCSSPTYASFLLLTEINQE